jgi:putative serine protease PepD
VSFGMTQTTEFGDLADGHPSPTSAAQPPVSGAQPPYEGPESVPGREPRRPGWTGVVAVGAGAALLSSVLTAGAVHAVDHRSGPVSSSSTPSAQQSAPLVHGSSKTAPNWTPVAAAVEPSVVSVQVQASDGTGGEGSGVILNTRGQVLTNNHVVADAGTGGSISVVLSDGRIYQAGVVGTDPSTDLAVIAMKKPPSGLTPARFGDSAAVGVGDQVMAVGNPLGLSETVTTGIVSALNRPVTTSSSTPDQQSPFTSPFGNAQPQTEQVVTNAIQTDAAINPGNSGGALVDYSGRVIGITSSIASLGSDDPFGGNSQSGSIGLGFAIPSDEAARVAHELITTGAVQHAYLGVTLADGTAIVSGVRHEAAVIGSVTGGTPAAKAGLESRDAIIAVNGEPVESADSLVAQVRALSPGAKITLTIVRSGNQKAIALTLAVRPTSSD